MKKTLLLCLFMGLSSTLSAQKISIEPGMGLGFGILTSGVTQTDGNRNSMGVALQVGMHYHFNPQLSLGFHFLAQGSVTGDYLNTPTEVTFLPENNSTHFVSVNGRYAFNTREREHFFFIGLGLGLNRNWSHINVNDVETIGKTSLSLMPEVGFQAKRVSFVLSFTTPVSSPTFDQLGNDDGIRYVMEKGYTSTLNYSIRYQFRLYGSEQRK